MSDAQMQFLGESGGVRWYWAEPGRFVTPGVYYWDGTNNVHVAAPQASQPPQGADIERLMRLAKEYASAALAAPPQWAFSLHECVRRFLNTGRLDNTTLGQFVKEASELLAASPLPAPQEPVAKVISFDGDRTGTVEWLVHQGAPLTIGARLYAAPAPDSASPLSSSTPPGKISP